MRNSRRLIFICFASASTILSSGTVGIGAATGAKCNTAPDCFRQAVADTDAARAELSTLKVAIDERIKVQDERLGELKSRISEKSSNLDAVTLSSELYLNGDWCVGGKYAHHWEVAIGGRIYANGADGLHSDTISLISPTEFVVGPLANVAAPVLRFVKVSENTVKSVEVLNYSTGKFDAVPSSSSTYEKCSQ